MIFFQCEDLMIFQVQIIMIPFARKDFVIFPSIDSTIFPSKYCLFYQANCDLIIFSCRVRRDDYFIYLSYAQRFVDFFEQRLNDFFRAKT